MLNHNQTHLTLEGRTYVAVESTNPGRCAGCAFPEGFGCRAVQVLQGPALCQPKDRQDGRHIVWVQASAPRYEVRAWAPQAAQWHYEEHWTLAEAIQAERDLEAMGFTQVSNHGR